MDPSIMIGKVPSKEKFPYVSAPRMGVDLQETVTAGDPRSIIESKSDLTNHNYWEIYVHPLQGNP